MSKRALWVLFGLLLVVHSVYFVLFFPQGLDDAFIFFRVAAKSLAGAGSVFNDGDRHFIVSSPLWLWMLIAAKAAIPVLSLPSVSYLVYLGLSIAGSFALRRLLLPHDPVAAAMSPVVLLSSTPGGAAIGMETSLVFVLGLGLLLAHSRRALPTMGLLSALLYLARPDGLLLVALVWLAHLQGGGTNRRKLRERLAGAGPALALFLPIVLGWHAYHFWAFNSLLPDTLWAKLAQGHSDHFMLFHSEVAENAAKVLRGSFLLYALAALGAIRMLRHVPLLVLWALAHTLAYTVLRVPSYHWYYATLGYALLVAAILGISWTLTVGWRRGTAGRITAAAFALALVVVTYGGLDLQELGERLAWLRDGGLASENRSAQVSSRLYVYRRAALWIQLHTRPADRPVVFSDEVGIMGFYLRQYELRDSVGLATPRPDTGEIYEMEEVLRRYAPRYVVMGLRRRSLSTLAALFYVESDGGRPRVLYQRATDFERGEEFACRIYERVDAAGAGSETRP